MNQGITDLLAAPTQAVEAMGLFSSVCTVRQCTNTVSATGQVDYSDAGYADIAGVVGVACMRAPSSSSRVVGGALDTAGYMESFTLYHVLLDDYYPQIPEPIAGTADLIAVIDGVRHQLLAVESSSQRSTAKQTRLEVKQVSL